MKSVGIQKDEVTVSRDVEDLDAREEIERVKKKMSKM